MYNKRLKELRSKLDLSISKMALKMDMSGSTLTSYERGVRTPSCDFLAKLYEKFNVNINWFVSGHGNMFNPKKYEDVEEELTIKVENILRKNGLI